MMKRVLNTMTIIMMSVVFSVSCVLGAPGYGAAVVFNPTLPDEVRVSELMFETEGSSRELPQWIEFYNVSQSPVNLGGWELDVETRTTEAHRHATLTLNSILLPPNQTVLLVTGLIETSIVLPTERVYDLFDEHPDAFSDRRLGNTVLGTEGFFLKLTHPTGRVVDTCGNLDGDLRTEDPPTWTLPIFRTPSGHRTSLLRRFEAGDVLKGTKISGWQRAADVAIGVSRYYGHPTDISSPGALHGIVPGASPTVSLSISEIMFTAETGDTTRLPQWIELYNPSFLTSVNLKDWQFVVETQQADKHHQIVIDLEKFYVLPNQTVLLITRYGRHSKHFPANRTYNLFERHPAAFQSLQQRHRLLSSEGFLIQLSDATGNVVDTIGNLDGYPFTEDTPAWALPIGETPEGARASIRRLYEKKIPLDGTRIDGWVPVADVPPVIMTYYGATSDVGNPGYRKGGPLPVTLSGFKAEHTEAGVVMTWTTESEVDNAGFYIYRSETKDGNFDVVNPTMITGAGTTGERTKYSWTDATAKPNTVYYYRIEDVSHAGVREQLATVRLRGFVSVKDKQLTKWSELKHNQKDY